MTEKELIEQCRKNQPVAQETLYNLYARKMLGVCMRYTADVETARDLLQDGFVTVFTMFHTFQGAGSLEGWIRRIMVNTALQYLRKNDVFQDSADIADYESSLPVESDIVSSLSAKDLMRMIASLPTGFRTVFNLYAMEGYSHSEIAKMLHISEAGSRSQFSRARKQLQQMILAEYGVTYRDK